MKRTRINRRELQSRHIYKHTETNLKRYWSVLPKTVLLKRMCILLIPLIALVFPAKSAYGNLECVSWEELPDHLEKKSVDLLDLNVCDCPDNIEDMEPSRVIAQFIENTFYLWEEYDIAKDSETISLCIIMIKPQATPLLAEEAQILLTASSLWKVSTFQQENTAYDPSDLQSGRQPIEESLVKEGSSFTPKLVVGSDDRTRITNTTSYPWNNHCSLIIYFSDEPHGWQGTGCLVGPHTALTCAHNVYSKGTHTPPERITIAPGQKQEYIGGPVYQPYGTRESAVFRFHTSFLNSNSAQYEIGAVLIDNPFSGINTYIPVEFANSPSVGGTVHVAGYPVNVKLGTASQELDTWALWNGSGQISAMSSTVLNYAADTSGGETGAPIRSTQNHIIGVHAGGNPEHLINVGARLGSHNQALITEWMQWTPDQSEDVVLFEDTFTLNYIDISKWSIVEGATLAYVGDDQFILMNGFPYGGDMMETRTIDLSSYSGAVLSYEYKRRLPNWSDDLIFLYWNGWTWIEAHRQSGRQTEMDAYQLITIHLPLDALHPGFKLRIRSIGSANDYYLQDDWRIDNVKIMGWVGSTVILEETWPNLNEDPYKWTTYGVDVSGKGDNEPSPPYSMNFNTGDSLRSLTLDLSNYSRAVLTYYYQRTGGGESPDLGDDFVSMYWRNGSYRELRRHLGNGPDMTHFQKVTITLPPDAMHSRFRLYFESQGDRIWDWVYDDWFLDDVELRVWR